jgi:hypothetical protein
VRESTSAEDLLCYLRGSSAYAADAEDAGGRAVARREQAERRWVPAWALLSALKRFAHAAVEDRHGQAHHRSQKRALDGAQNPV